MTIFHYLIRFQFWFFILIKISTFTKCTAVTRFSFCLVPKKHKFVIALYINWNYNWSTRFILLNTAFSGMCTNSLYFVLSLFLAILFAFEYSFTHRTDTRWQPINHHLPCKFFTNFILIRTVSNIWILTYNFIMNKIF